MGTKEERKETIMLYLKIFLNLCIILAGQLFLFLFAVISAILPRKCPKCKVWMVVTISKHDYPSTKKCPNCGARNFEM